MVPHARASARGPKQPKRGFRPRGARVAPRGVRVAETSGCSSASPRARTSAIAAEPPLTAASAAAASGACSAISPNRRRDPSRIGAALANLFSARVTDSRSGARASPLEAASATTPPRLQKTASARVRSRPDPIAEARSPRRVDGPTRPAGRCGCATEMRDRRPRDSTRHPTTSSTVPPLPLLRVETRAHSAAAPNERPRWLSRDVTRASPAEPPMPKREIERVVAFQRTLSRRAERARLRANISVERASARAFSLKRNDLSSLLTHYFIVLRFRLLPVRAAPVATIAA